MNASVLPFPRSRDGGYIERHARLMVEAASDEKAEAHLRRQLTIQHDTMGRRGVAVQTIADELTAIERQIRAAAQRIMLAEGGLA